MEIPNKVWRIVGHRPARNLKNYAYTTDPRSYDLPGLKQMTDEEYQASADRVKAFIKRDDAIVLFMNAGSNRPWFLASGLWMANMRKIAVLQMKCWILIGKHGCLPAS